MGWGCGEDKICGARSRSLKCIAAARLENTSSSTDGFQRHPQILSSPPPQRLSFRRDERLRQVCRPSAGLRRLIVSRSKCGENLVVATTCICLRLFFSLSMSKDAASRSGGSNRGHPRLTVETISGGRDKSRCERQKLRPSLQSPSINLAGGRRRNQFWRGHGSPPVLSEVFYELSTAANSKECERSP